MNRAVKFTSTVLLSVSSVCPFFHYPFRCTHAHVSQRYVERMYKKPKWWIRARMAKEWEDKRWNDDGKRKREKSEGGRNVRTAAGRKRGIPFRRKKDRKLLTWFRHLFYSEFRAINNVGESSELRSSYEIIDASISQKPIRCNAAARALYTNHFQNSDHHPLLRVYLTLARRHGNFHLRSNSRAPTIELRKTHKTVSRKLSHVVRALFFFVKKMLYYQTRSPENKLNRLRIIRPKK